MGVDIVFAGTPEAAVPALRALHHSNHRIKAVLTRPDAPVGRKRILTPSPVKLCAAEFGYPVLEANKLRGDVISQLRELEVAAVAVVAYGAIAGPAALSTATHGWFNLHFSLLPAYRGAAPVQRALMAGDSTSGVSIFRIDEGMDTGPIVRSLELPLDHPDAAAALRDYAQRGAHELVAAFDDIAAGQADFREQTGPASHADKLLTDDARLDFSRTAGEIVNLSRGMTPSPGPWATIAGKRTKLFGLKSLSEGSSDSDEITPAGPVIPGLLRAAGQRALLGCADGWVTVDEVQPFGKSRMSALDFLRGRGDTQFDTGSESDNHLDEGA